MAVSLPTFLRPAVTLAAALLIAGCNNPTGPSIEKTRFASSLGVDIGASTRTASGLYYRDITAGTGATAAAGEEATVTYALYNTNGSKWDEGTFTFKIVAANERGEVVAGFNEGVLGMKVGGRRQLIIPPHLGYGNQWWGAIPPNSILVFDVTLQNTK